MPDRWAAARLGRTLKAAAKRPGAPKAGAGAEPVAFRKTSAMVSGMKASGQFDEGTVCRLGEARKPVEPCSIIIFGASGDLTARKLIPALYHLHKEKQMPPDYRIIGGICFSLWR